MPVTIDKMKAVFLATLDKTTAAERTAFLDEACADEPALRHSVEALLRAHERADPLLDHPAAEHLEWPSSERAAPEDALGFLDPSSRPDSLGRIGHYEVLEVLGRGGFGIVLRAFDDCLQRVVAVKVLAPQLAAAAPARKRFLREARSAAQVRHENVVQVYAVEEQALPYLVMEFIPGETLQRRLDRTGPLEVAEVVRIGRQIALGLAAAHGTGLIHGDIKPANILIESGSRACVKIVDFGLARAADDASMTQYGFFAGTPMFMAPEQVSGETLDHRADLFGLGSVLYTMCAGQPPFRAISTLAVLKRVAEDTPPPIPEIVPEVPQWLCDLIARLHAKQPADRIATAAEVADLLARGMENRSRDRKGADASEIPPLPYGRGSAGFRSRRWAAAAAVLLLLLGGLGLTEATGVTNMRGTVVRLFSSEGTLVVEVDDPGVSIKIDGSDIVITGAGAKEIRLKPGKYTVEARKDGKVVRRELVAVTNNGRQVVRVSQEPVEVKANAAEWERSVAAMPKDEKLKAVSARLKELNPGYSGQIKRPGHNEIDMDVTGPELRDISPIRAMPGVRVLHIRGANVTDLSPLRWMGVAHLDLDSTGVSDLSPLQDVKSLRQLDLSGSREVTDLSPLKGMSLTELSIAYTRVGDLTPLRDMKLHSLNCESCPVSDLSPLKKVPLKHLLICNTKVSDLSPLKGMSLTSLRIVGSAATDLSPLEGLPLEHLRCDFVASRDAKILRAIKTLKYINGKPAARFWKEVDGK